MAKHPVHTRRAQSTRRPLLQRLEPRLLMAAAPADDLKHGPLARVGTALAQASREFIAYMAAGKAPASFRSADRLLHTRADRVQVEAYAAIDGAALEKDLRALDMTDVHRYGNAVAGSIPLAKIAAMAILPSLSFARPLWYRTRSVTGQQDAALRGDIARFTFPYTGAGVKVGILSDSFDTGPGSYAADIASGDLPAGIQVIQDSANGTDEGRAMAQLVYDTAPGASLAFATAFVGGQPGFASNIRALRDAGCKVIIDDVIYFAEPMFQDGVIAQAVDDVVGTNVAYFSAAGNEGRQAYQSAFSAGIQRADGSIQRQGQAPRFYGGLTHDFDPGPGVDDMQAFTLAPGQSITLSLQWAQPYGSVPGSASSASDLDVYVLNSAGTRVLGGSATNNAGAGLDPVEVFSFSNSGQSSETYNLMICRYSGSSPALIKYVNFDTQNFTEYNTNSGAVYGHPNAAGAAAVGAAAWFNTPAYGVSPPAINSYSSRGNTPIFYSAAGTLLGAIVTRQRPQIVAPDGGNTTFFYSDTTYDADTLPNFFGTSAAAPAAGAVAALLLQAKTSLTPAQVYTALQSTALDMDDPDNVGFDTGFDDATGWGFVRADAALAAILGASLTGTVFHDRDADGAHDVGEPGVVSATIFDDANDNGILDAGEASAITSGSGAFTLGNLAPGLHTIREIAPAGFAATTPALIFNVNGSATGADFANIATAYTGTSDSDLYTLRRKPADTRFEIVINGVVSYTLPASGLPPLSFDLLGGSDSLTLDLSTSAESATIGASTVSVGALSASCVNIESIVVNAQGNNDTLTLTPEASASFAAGPQLLQSLTIAAASSLISPAGGASPLYVQSLTVAGTLDLNDNDLVVESAAFSDIRALVFAGYSATPDSGKTGIVSSTGQSAGNTILALFDNAIVGATEWPLGSGHTISPNAVVGTYTFFGDANLDGQVTSDDYAILDSNLNTTPAPGVAWLSGDANMDSSVTNDDYAILDSTLGSGVGNPLSPESLEAMPKLAPIGMTGSVIDGMFYRRQPRDVREVRPDERGDDHGGQAAALRGDDRRNEHEKWRVRLLEYLLG